MKIILNQTTASILFVLTIIAFLLIVPIVDGWYNVTAGISIIAIISIWYGESENTKKLIPTIIPIVCCIILALLPAFIHPQVTGSEFMTLDNGYVQSEGYGNTYKSNYFFRASDINIGMIIFTVYFSTILSLFNLKIISIEKKNG